MSMRKTINNYMTACENSTICIKRFFNFMKGLSFKSKSYLDIQLKSHKKLRPIWKCGFNCDKEIRVMPIIYTVIGIMFVLSLFCSSKDCCDD